jgi:hypothetical protein
VAADLPDGAYDVRWRVVSADGHPVSGAFAFAVGDAVLPEAGAGATATPEPSPDAESTASADDAGPDAGTGLPLAVVGLLGALGGLAIFALFTVWRAKRHRNP